MKKIKEYLLNDISRRINATKQEKDTKEKSFEDYLKRIQSQNTYAINKKHALEMQDFIKKFNSRLLKGGGAKNNSKTII